MTAATFPADSENIDPGFLATLIEKLIENFTIHTATMGESMDQMKAAVLDTLMGALNDTQLATE